MRRAVGGPRGAGPAARPQAVGAEISQSPKGNTGDKLTRDVVIRHDWLNMTFPVASRDLVQQVIEQYLGASVRRERGANTYAESVGWDVGCLLAWSEARPECWLSMNGDSCDLILPEHKLELLRELMKLGGKCTRIDVAIDVVRDLVGMEDVHAAARADQVVGFRRYDPRRVLRDMSTGELEQDQANFGRRGRDGSGRYVRVYDKGLESDGKLDFIRFEAELSGDTAAHVFSEYICYCEDQADLERVLGRLAVGSIDFAEKTGAHSHRDRYKRLGWWDRIVSLVGSARVKVERVPATLERSVEWLKTATPVVLARLVQVVDNAGMAGVDLLNGFVRQLLEKGRDRLNWRANAYPGDERFDLGVLFGGSAASGTITGAVDPFA